MNKLIICLIMGVFLLTGMNAGDNDYMGQQFMDIPIIEICEDDGFACDATYSCNITITNPNQQVIILNQPMTRNDTFYNFTLIDTDLLGVYKIKTICGNGTFSGTNEDGRLEVTTTGSTYDTLKINIFLLIGAVFLFLIGIYLKNYAIGFLSGMLFLIAGVYMVIYGFGNFADMYTRAIGVIIIALGGLLTIVAGLEWLEEVD